MLCGFFWCVCFVGFLTRPLSTNLWQPLLVMSLLWPSVILWIRGHKILISPTKVVYKRPILQSSAIPITGIRKLDLVFPHAHAIGPVRLLIGYADGQDSKSISINVKLISRRDIKTLLQAVNPKGMPVGRINTLRR